MHRFRKINILHVLQITSLAMLIGASLFMYNDWRDHRTLAAPNNSNNPPVVEDPTQTPLTLPDQSVSGNVTINPDGSVEQRSD